MRITGIYLAIYTFMILGHLTASGQKILEDSELLKLFDGLRVADVSDGMDMVGLRDAGLMGTEFETHWKDTESLLTKQLNFKIKIRDK